MVFEKHLGRSFPIMEGDDGRCTDLPKSKILSEIYSTFNILCTLYETVFVKLQIHSATRYLVLIPVSYKNLFSACCYPVGIETRSRISLPLQELPIKQHLFRNTEEKKAPSKE